MRCTPPVNSNEEGHREITQGMCKDMTFMSYISTHKTLERGIQSRPCCWLYVSLCILFFISSPTLHSTSICVVHSKSSSTTCDFELKRVEHVHTTRSKLSVSQGYYVCIFLLILELYVSELEMMRIAIVRQGQEGRMCARVFMFMCRA